MITQTFLPRVGALLLLSLLAACEQSMVVGPIGGAQVLVEELRTEIQVSPDTLMTGSDRDATLINPDFQSLDPGQQLGLIGLTTLNTLPVDDATWYLVHIRGGFDFDADGNGLLDSGAVQVSDHAAHALMTGELIKAGGHLIGPLSEAAWRWVEPFYIYMTDSELRAALDEFAVTAMVDIRAQDGVHDYRDLLTFNPLYHSETTDFKGSMALLRSLKSAMTTGEMGPFRRGIVIDMIDLDVPLGAAEAMFRERISPDIAQGNCVQCHVAGGQAGSTRYVLRRGSNANVLADNLDAFEALVSAIGVETILNKAAGIAHGGGTRLAQGSDELADFETWLELL